MEFYLLKDLERTRQAWLLNTGQKESDAAGLSEPGLTRGVCRESCTAGSCLLWQQLEARGGAEGEEEEQSGAAQHRVRR